MAKHVGELQQGADVLRVTLQQLATYTSGFVLPQDHPPWPERTFALPEFIATLNAWRSDMDHEPGKQSIYSHAGFVLMHLALERRYGMPYDELMRERLLNPVACENLNSCISMVKSGKDRMHNNVSEPLRWACAGRILLERNVSSCFIIISEVFRKNSPKVLLAENDQMISALAPDRPNQAFNIDILPGRTERGRPVSDAR